MNDKRNFWAGDPDKFLGIGFFPWLLAITPMVITLVLFSMAAGGSK